MNPYEFSVSLRFSGPNFDPDLVAGYLGREPKSKHVRGSSRLAKNGSALGGTYENNYCSFLLCQKRSGELSVFLSEQISALQLHAARLDSHTKSGNKVEFFIGWYGSGNIGEIFDSNLLRHMGTLGIDMSLDIYSN